MTWLKQNWIKVGLVILGIGYLFFITYQYTYQKELARIMSQTLATVYEPDHEQVEFPYFGEKSILSPDKKLTVFLKVYPETNMLEGRELGYIPYDEIWIKNNNSGEEKLLVKTGDVSSYSFANSDNFPFSNIYGLQDIIFSLNGKKVYFSSYAWSTSSAIFSVDIYSGKLHFVSDGNSLEVLGAGPYKGNLKISKHKYYGPPNYGSYDHYYVITDKGKEIKDLGE